MLLMLEDDAERIDRFTRTLTRVNATLDLRIWRSAWTMLREAPPLLPAARLICLDHDLEPLDGDATDQVLRPIDHEVEASAGLVDHAPRCRDDLRAHAIAGDRRDAIPRTTRRGEVGPCHGIPSP